MTTPSIPSSVPGVNVMLCGASGAGKTHALRTLLDAGLEVFVLFTEPGMEVLADTPSDRLHWHYIPPASPDFADMISSAEKINSMSIKMLSDLPDINKRKYTEFIDILTTLSNFKCDRTGQSYGSVDSWGRDDSEFWETPTTLTGEILPREIYPEKESSYNAWKANAEKYGLTPENGYGMNRVLVVDSLTGLSLSAMNLVTGSKPVKCLADWGIAIDNLERLLTKLCVDTKCHFVLIAHLEREVDEVTGGTSLMASTLGRKLAPKLPRFFSDVVHVKQVQGKFVWSTTTSNVDTKTRNLALSETLPPSFVPIIASWKKYQPVETA